jgi:hypothetical protein
MLPLLYHYLTSLPSPKVNDELLATLAAAEAGRPPPPPCAHVPPPPGLLLPGPGCMVSGVRVAGDELRG